MNCRQESFEMIERFKEKICGVRHGLYYISNPLNAIEGTEDMTSEEIYAAGVKAGMYDGIEVCLGLLEDIEKELNEELSDEIEAEDDEYEEDESEEDE